MAAAFAPYRKLLKRFHEIALLNSSAELLAWDQETYMPPAALSWRADQLAHFGGQAHRLATARSVGDWIAACEDHDFPKSSSEAVNVRNWRRDYERATRVPARLVERLEKTRALAREAWMRARKDSQFKVFRPHLKKLVELNLKLADCWGYAESPYDALLEEYEPGATTRELQNLFNQLRPKIAALIPEAVARSGEIQDDFLDDDYPVAAQRAFNRKVVAAMGFDLEAGRIDTTTHPFCTGLGPNDCRLTVRYYPRDFTHSLSCIMHEAGHGLYDQGLAAEHYGTPLGSAVSLGIHESQSRLWENHVGRSRIFWEHWHPVACDHFPGLKRFTPEQITRFVNRVRPSFIRVDADEVTYDLHIALRFEIERQLIHRELNVADVAASWNDQFEQLVGLRVPEDAKGCLQDIHWSLGSFGYFPTYTLGNLNASQLMKQARKEIQDLETSFQQGDYAPLLAWLRDKIHLQGRRHSPGALIKQATGKTLSADAHLSHLESRYLGSA
jgi:carboxypeptidase Taq